jgi:hypothetical protein
MRLPATVVTMKDRLLHRIRKMPSGCWEVQFGINKQGYGVISVGQGKNPEKYQAHRVAYEVFVGEIPNGLFVCHKCDNTKCVNPDHLFLGTHTDNMRDMINKGRRYITYGERSGLCKLTTEQVLKIRKDTRLGTIIAKEYGVTKSTISMIRTRASRCYE